MFFTTNKTWSSNNNPHALRFYIQPNLTFRIYSVSVIFFRVAFKPFRKWWWHRKHISASSNSQHGVAVHKNGRQSRQKERVNPTKYFLKNSKMIFMLSPLLGSQSCTFMHKSCAHYKAAPAHPHPPPSTRRVIIESFPLEVTPFVIDLDGHNCLLVDYITISGAWRCHWSPLLIAMQATPWL